MLLPFSLGVAEWLPIWERPVNLVNCACLSGAFVKFCVCPSFPFGTEGRMWNVTVLVPDHCLSMYFEFTVKKIINDTELISTFSSNIQSRFTANHPKIILLVLSLIFRLSMSVKENIVFRLFVFFFYLQNGSLMRHFVPQTDLWKNQWNTLQ